MEIHLDVRKSLQFAIVKINMIKEMNKLLNFLLQPKMFDLGTPDNLNQRLSKRVNNIHKLGQRTNIYSVHILQKLEVIQR